ncbi:NUDIX hydrolase [Nitriliruptoraceae bacterium ZYF776]|nr:NUDIX hydrolase [Profundirhabdus halotolerans]
MTSEPTPAWFETIEERTVYDGFSRVVVERLRAPDGSEVDREIVDHDDAVAVVPVDDHGRVLLLKQYRQPLRGYLLEIPAGKLDVEGEAPQDAAQRELAEELGFRAGRLTPLSTVWNSAGWSTERTHLYLGQDLVATAPPDGFVAQAEEADMEIVPFALSDALAMARDGDLVDAKTVLGLLLAAPILES